MTGPLPPQRIFVTGNAGSGKTTLACELGRRLHLPVHSLDRIVWQAGWKKTPDREKEEQIARLTSDPRWIVDGVSSIAERAADFVIFLDVSPILCTWRSTKRNSRFLFRSRPQLPENRPEIAIIPELLKIIWRFDRRVRPAILSRMDNRRCGQSYFRVRSIEDRKWVLSELDARVWPE